MNRLLLVVFAGVACLGLCSFFWSSFSEDRKMACKIAGEVADKFEKKYGLEYCGISEAAPEGKYQNLGMDFFIYRKLSQDEGRRILLELEYDFLHKINSTKSFRKHMLYHPFSCKDIVINIFVRPTKKFGDVYYPDYRIFSVYNDKLFYGYYIREKTGPSTMPTQDSETLEEARKIVEEQKRVFQHLHK